VGCGLGEASTFFAIQGADVVATDLSSGMLDATQRSATKYGVRLRTHKSSAESLELGADERFDAVYVGNLFHHVEIEPTIERIKKHMKPDGKLVSWDPIAYNPLINIYRRIATETRTVDEHPLTRGDLKLFEKHFRHVEFRWFWFTTLLLFVIMAVQGRNPNKVRYWKKIVEEGERWRWLYIPLERLDRILLAVFPFLRWWCWNVVVIASGAK
jgi:2-polyprenyl-3-methyl-5-hydroxy-6-metoxy-1,4-benzoquinol methylase